MLGPGGRCRASCQDCISCPPADVLCLRRNMRSLRQQRQTQGQEQQGELQVQLAGQGQQQQLEQQEGRQQEL